MLAMRPHPIEEPRTGDAFGRILQRCWAAGGAPGVAYEMTERSDGFMKVNDASVYFTGRDAWPAHELAAVDAATGRVLDIGCGTGRHVSDLLARGVDAAGLEPSPGAAAVTRERGVPVIETTVEALDPAAGPFDTYLMLANNLALLGSPEHAPRVLGALAAAAGPGARILGSCRAPLNTNSPEHRRYQERNRSDGRMPGHLRLRVRDRDLATDWFDYLFLTPDELAGLIEGSPWRLHDVVSGGASDYLAVLSLAG